MKSITIYERPVATVAYPDTLVCAGGVITLGVTAQPGVSYAWVGPNGFSSTVQFPNTPVLATANGGYYQVTLSRGLCTSIPDSTLVTVKPQPMRPVLGNSGPVCAGQPLTLSTTFNGASAYRWIPPSGLPITTTTPSYSIPAASMAQQGAWQLVVTVNGCDSPVSLPTTVVVNPAPDATAAAMPNPACQGDNVQLNGFSNIAGSSFAWSGPNGYTSSVQQPTLSNITLSRAGDYKLVVTTGAGCKDSTTLALEVLENVQITGLSDNVTACINDGFDVLVSSAVLPSDDGSYTYEWQFNGQVVSNAANLTIPNAVPADDGVYTLEVFTAEGCSSGTSSITLDLNFIPSQPTQPVTISGSNSFCEGEEFTLITSAVTGEEVAYYWETPAGVIVTNENMLTVDEANVGDDGIYRVYVIRNGCASTLSPPRDITINPIPNILLTSNTPVCEGDVLSLQSTFYPTGSYTWSGPGGFGNGVTVHNPIINNTDSLTNDGIYRVFVTVAGCTSDTVSTDVWVRNRPQEPAISHDMPVCIDNPDAVLTLSINAGSIVPGATYAWFTQNGSVSVSPAGEETAVEITDFSLFQSGGLFPFYATTTVNGCESSLSNPTLVQFDTIPINTAYAGNTTVCSESLFYRGYPFCGYRYLDVSDCH
ncbi:MAG: hypothetical protein R2795_15090 [Saprospiraceae bacterium]